MYSSSMENNTTVLSNICLSKKALLFNDHELAKRIMRMTDPLLMKRAVTRIHGFDKTTWKDNAPKFLQDALTAKSFQHITCKEALMKTGNRILGEASPSDRLFGIGS